MGSSCVAVAAAAPAYAATGSACRLQLSPHSPFVRNWCRRRLRLLRQHLQQRRCVRAACSNGTLFISVRADRAPAPSAVEITGRAAKKRRIRSGLEAPTIGSTSKQREPETKRAERAATGRPPKSHPGNAGAGRCEGPPARDKEQRPWHRTDNSESPDAVVVGGGRATASPAPGARLRLGSTLTSAHRAQPAGRACASAWPPARRRRRRRGDLGEDRLSELALASHRAWPEFAAELAEAAGQDVGMLELGALHIALDRDEAAGGVEGVEVDEYGGVEYRTMAEYARDFIITRNFQTAGMIAGTFTGKSLSRPPAASADGQAGTDQHDLVDGRWFDSAGSRSAAQIFRSSTRVGRSFSPRTALTSTGAPSRSARLHQADRDVLAGLRENRGRHHRVGDLDDHRDRIHLHRWRRPVVAG